jgi:hypothetical protein
LEVASYLAQGDTDRTEIFQRFGLSAFTFKLQRCNLLKMTSLTFLPRPQEVTITQQTFGRKHHNLVMTGSKNTSPEKGPMLKVTCVPQDLSRVDADKKHASQVKKRAKQVNRQLVGQQRK